MYPCTLTVKVIQSVCRAALYPYREENGDAKLRRRHDKAKKFKLETGFPVRDTLQRKLFVSLSRLSVSVLFDQQPFVDILERFSPRWYP